MAVLIGRVDVCVSNIPAGTDALSPPPCVGHACWQCGADAQFAVKHAFVYCAVMASKKVFKNRPKRKVRSEQDRKLCA